MSKHRFDHTVDHSDNTKAERQPDRLRRIEVITGVERRRKWSLGEKLEIVAESFAAGAVVSEVARRHGISPQQLFGWRVRLREEMTARAPAASPAFVPAIVDSMRPGPLVAEPEAAALPAPASIEITLGCAVVRVRGVVDARALTAVLKALKVAS
jgi:transposase